MAGFAQRHRLECRTCSCVTRYWDGRVGADAGVGVGVGVGVDVG